MGLLKTSLSATASVALALLLAHCSSSSTSSTSGDASTKGDGSVTNPGDAGDAGSKTGDAGSKDATSDSSTSDAGAGDAGGDATGDAPVADGSSDATGDGNTAAQTCNALVTDAGGAPGAFDPTFNNVVEPASIGGATHLLQDAQGRIYLLGSKSNCVSSTSNADFAITRLKPDGTVDTSFGAFDGGTTAIDADGGLVAAGGTVCLDFEGGADLLGAAAIDPSGNIVVAGMATIQPGSPSASVATYYYSARVAVARILPDGSLDQTFNGTGKNRIAAGPPEAQQAQGIAIDSLGDIFLVGTTQALPVPSPGASTANYAQLAGFVVKVGSSGTVNTLWGASGFEIDDTLTELNGATVAGNSLFVVGADLGGGVDGGAIGHRRFVVRKYATTGTGGLDTTFGTGGEVSTAPGQNDYAQSVAVDPQGNLVVAGLASVGTTGLGGGGFSAGPYGPGYAAVVRYTPAGALDTTFGTAGVYVSPDLKGFPAYEPAMLGVQCDGKVLVGALVCPLANITASEQSLAVLRLTAAGAPDTTYAAGGDAGAGIASLVLTSNTNVNSILVDPQQRALVLSGIGGTTTGPVLTRFLP
jgi:uncharacterized delta-60 repeat protein